MDEFHGHRPVLLQEALKALDVTPAGTYVDGTFGRGGHSRKILAALGRDGRLLAIDKDPVAVAFGRRQFGDNGCFSIEQGSFAMLEQLAQKHDLQERVDGILLDLGVSSPQLDDPARGFSFQQDGPLDMRMDPDAGRSAREWLATADARRIADVLRDYGEERFARRIASAIVDSRRVSPIETTGQLADIIRRANPAWEKDRDPATRSFQAIRIYINRELDDLRDSLSQSLRVLARGGRLVVISFHSLEDRIVKRFIRDQARGDEYPRGVPVTEDQLRPRMRSLGKARRPGAREVAENPRARSAVLRAAELL
jgi:16S rRNA (cytosine1402-N4)-methyltransferase